MMEVRAHCATDDFGVPHVNGSGQRDRCLAPSAAAVRMIVPDVPGILHGVEQQDPHLAGSRNRFERCGLAFLRWR